MRLLTKTDGFSESLEQHTERCKEVIVLHCQGNKQMDFAGGGGPQWSQLIESSRVEAQQRSVEAAWQSKAADSKASFFFFFRDNEQGCLRGFCWGRDFCELTRLIL